MIIITNCAPPPSHQETDFLTQAVWNDIKNIPFHFDNKTVEDFDKKTKSKPFLKIFGGYSGEHVQRFITQRVKHIQRRSDRLSYTDPQQFRYDQWALSTNASVANELDTLHIERIGYNYGTFLYYMKMINGVSLHFVKNDRKAIEITSTRDGIIVVEEGYSKLPFEELKISHIVHEAWHSDCSEEVEDEDFQVGRVSRSLKEFTENFKKKKCGHLHTFCLQLKGLENEPACDDHYWGAYSGTILYLKSSWHKEFEINENFLKKGMFPPDMVSTSKKKMILMDKMSRILHLVDESKEKLNRRSNEKLHDEVFFNLPYVGHIR